MPNPNELRIHELMRSKTRRKILKVLYENRESHFGLKNEDIKRACKFKNASDSIRNLEPMVEVGLVKRIDQTKCYLISNLGIQTFTKLRIA